MYTPPTNDQSQTAPLRPPNNPSASETSPGSGNRRRTSSFGFNSTFFSNLTSSLRNSSSSTNIPGQVPSPTSNSTQQPSSGNRSRAGSSSRLNLIQSFQASNNSNNSISRLSRNNSSSNLTPPRNSGVSIPTGLNRADDIADQMMGGTPIDDALQGQTRSNSLRAGGQQKVPHKLDSDGTYSIRLTPFIDHSSTTAGLYFGPVLRKTKPNTSLSIGRYTDKVREAAQAPPGSDAPVVFKSKVVSRTHAEFFVNEYGEWFVKDLKSSSGTFLNHIRLSPAGSESIYTSIQNGDVLQLGMDFRGGVEDIFRCVRMRVEMNKSWQRKASHFNKETHEKLKSLALLDESDMDECAICLLKIKPCQSVFISPCSHCWHYKCIRPIVVKSYPQFLCPNCRETCDLEADDEESELETSDDEANDLLDGESQSSQLKKRASDEDNDLILEESAEDAHVH